MEYSFLPYFYIQFNFNLYFDIYLLQKSPSDKLYVETIKITLNIVVLSYILKSERNVYSDREKVKPFTFITYYSNYQEGERHADHT